jgi:hypothetical protein
MKRLALIAIAFGFLLMSCTDTPIDTSVSPSPENPSIDSEVYPSTESNNKDEVTVTVPEIFIDSKAGLTEILGIDFTGIEIAGLWYDFSPEYSFTEIYLFCISGNDTVLYKNLFDISDNLFVADVVLERAGLSKTDIQKQGGHFKSIDNGRDELPYYSIELYLLKEPRADGSNVFIYAGPDAKVKIDVDAILAE